MQGVDYAYNLQGWLKGVNSSFVDTVHDIGKDNKLIGNNADFARDAYSFTLDYFDNDYASISGNIMEADYTTYPFGSASSQLYNGNIRHAVYSLPKMDDTHYRNIGYAYQYDQLNRLMDMSAYVDPDLKNFNWYKAPYSPDYHEEIGYDGNGNILRYLRNKDNSGTQMDSMTYFYYPSSNKIKYVRDNVGAAIHIGDIDNEVDSNYRYDKIGNLIKDSAETLRIVWNTYGKIDSIYKYTKDTIINFVYDPSGNRVSNKMQSSFQGFKFIAATITTTGSYGNPNDVTDNHWEGNYLSNNHQRITGIVDPLNWFHRNALTPSNSYCPYYYGGPLNPIQASNAQTFTCDFSLAGDGRDDILRIAGDSVSYNDFPSENTYYDDEFAFNRLTDDSAFMYSGSPSDLNLQQWYAAERTGNLGRFKDVRDYIEAKDRQAAIIANLSIVDSTIILQNLRTATDIYLNYYFDATGIVQLDSLTYNILLNIALQNGVQGGEGVYMSRAMLNIDVEDNIALLRLANPNNISVKNQVNKIYPNPSTGEFTIEYSIEHDAKAKVIISNCIGQSIAQFQLNNTSKHISFDLSEFGNGIYFFKIIINDNLIQTGKLMLAK